MPLKKTAKRLISLLLAFVLAFGAVPMETKAEEIIEDELQQALYLIPEGYPNIDFLAPGTEYTVPETVTADEAKARVLDLAEKFEGKFFTVSGNYCTASGIHATACSNCLMSNVIAAEWVEELVGMGTLDASLCPTQYSYKGTQGSADGYQCFGFANFAHWYVFAGKNTDKVTSTLELTGPMTYETMIKALPGDVIRSNYYGGHSMIFIDCDSTGYTVLDSNHTGNADGKSACIVKVHKVKYNAKYTVAVTGTTNYDRESATEYFLVKYNANGGTGAPASQIKTEDVNLVLTSDIPTFEGREFLGWARTADAAVPEFAPGAEYSENADITLYAVWSECKHEYDSVITEPTCTERGYTTYTCRFCGESYVDGYVDETGHSYEGVSCAVCGAEHPNLKNCKGKVISILGDSISTFKGYIPVADGFNEEHPYTYPANTVNSWDKTWWGQVIEELDAKLGINDSWSGSRVQNTYTDENPGGNVGTKVCMPSITRTSNLGANGTPDIIIIYAGTNDGKFSKFVPFDPSLDYSNVDLDAVTWSSFEDAYVAMIMRLQYYYPETKIISLLPTYVTSWYTDEKLSIMNDSIKQICEYFNITYVDLRECGITTANLPDGLHPDAEGMDYITDAVLKVILNEHTIDCGENIVHSITHNLEAAKASKGHYKGISKGRPFEETLTGDFEFVTVTMNGIDITEKCYTHGKIEIINVTGDIVITTAAHTFKNGICTICGEWEYPMGDINLDGSVDVKDAYYARLVAAKLIRPTEQQILLGDVDLDGKITALDANIIRKFVAKIITEIPVEK